MPPIRIVTDSSAHFLDPHFPKQHGLTILPLGLRFGASVVSEISLTTDEVFKRVADGSPIPTIEAPTPEQFAATFEELARTADTIVALHCSGKLSRVPQMARAGAHALLGRCNIIVIDSLSTSLGLGLLVETAALEAERGAAPDDLVRAVRGKISQLYACFFTETTAYLAQSGQLGPAHAILGGMLGIKPVLALEEGDLVPMEKVRTRQQALEKLVEYVVEFSDIERCAILQPTPVPTADTRQLLELLAVEFPKQHWPIIAYSPALAAILGPDAMGVIIHDGAED
jgi:DegV family protein with EDD domain